MYFLTIILACIVSILLILIVVIQNPKGGGIAANFSAANQIAGVKKTNEFVEKATWVLSIALVVLSISGRYLYSGPSMEKSDLLEDLEVNPAEMKASDPPPMPPSDPPADPAK